MSQPLKHGALEAHGADTIIEVFETHQQRFLEITRRGKQRFAHRDWHGTQADAAERLDLYRSAVARIVDKMRELLAEKATDKQLWAAIKAAYSSRILQRDDWEIAETFFNSLTRQIFDTVGVDASLEFVNTDFATPPTPAKTAVYRRYANSGSTADLVRKILSDYGFESDFRHIDIDVRLAAEKIQSRLKEIGALQRIQRADMIKNPFFRNLGAFLVGRLFSGSHLVPLTFALVNTPEGIVVDALILDEDAVSILFSFSRSCFHVAAERPYDLVRFLKTIVPRKRIAELYIAIGFSKHGKTELYRDLMLQMNTCCEEQFEISRGKPGMVMIVFNMPNDDLVFKIIRERFAQPKKTTREKVIEKYDMVFKHDRAGRLVDAQAFEHLKFSDCCFSDELLKEMHEYAGKTVSVQNGNVILQHTYIERRVIPLDIYVQEADEQAAGAAVLEFGRAIKDMAKSNVFPGDMLLKNFGVTRHGRVVFYDYDEICPLTSCKFRKLPQANLYEDDLAAEPWFYVDQDDVFPEEFEKFLGLPQNLYDLFMSRHADLFTVDFWQAIQDKLQRGIPMYIHPYGPEYRLRPDETEFATGRI